MIDACESGQASPQSRNRADAGDRDVCGWAINIPITRINRSKNVSTNPLAVYGLADFWPQMEQHGPETVIAVNVGGCLIPVGLSLYEIAYLAALTYKPSCGTVVYFKALRLAQDHETAARPHDGRVDTWRGGQSSQIAKPTIVGSLVGWLRSLVFQLAGTILSASMASRRQRFVPNLSRTSARPADVDPLAAITRELIRDRSGRINEMSLASKH